MMAHDARMPSSAGIMEFDCATPGRLTAAMCIVSRDMAGAHEVFLQRLAGDVAAAYVDHAGAVAALVAGSTAAGTCDEWSDIDLILFYRDWPGAPTLERTRSLLDPESVHTLG